jgi:DNA-damage-inducible protein J
MATSNINIRVDSKVKEEAEELFNKIGMNMSTAMNVFLRQSIRYGGIPFEIRLNEANEITRAAIEDVENNRNLSRPFDSIKVASAAGIIAAILFSIGDFLSGLGFPGNILSVQIARLPLGTVGMGWVIPTIVVIIITQIVVMLKTKEKQHVDVGG